MSLEPNKVFVKYIPANTTNDEVRTFFSKCGKVIGISMPKADQYTHHGYLYGFITYETQTEADQAVSELNDKALKNQLGVSHALSVVHAIVGERRHQSENVKEMEKKEMQSKLEHEELYKRFCDNEKKIKKIYNNLEEEKEIEKMRNKILELEEKQKQLMNTNDTIKQQNEVLRLQVKIKNLEEENTKLKEQQ